MFQLKDILLEDIDDQELSRIQEIPANHVAVIGISVKLPMAEHIDVFWHHLKTGVDCIRAIPEARRRDAESYLKYIGMPTSDAVYPEGAYLDSIDQFDPAFFRISPNEASLMDPSHRLFLETAWQAIEDAGYSGERIRHSNTGVYVSCGGDLEYKKIIAEVEPESLPLSMTGNIRPILAGRLSHLLDLKGPNMMIDTACSSSLVAVYTACRALITGECDMAIAGGVKLSVLPVHSDNLEDIGTASSSGRTRAFDHLSDGTGGGEGVVAVLLKPLGRALEDRDNIYAVIRGGAVNHDGESIGLTAPNPAAQEELLVKAWENSKVDPRTITYIEAHGTGTKLGDPIEVEGIERAFRRYTDRYQFCALGTLKSHIGHLDSAAGIAGFVKAVLAVKHGEMPPNLHFQLPNRKIAFHKSPVYINNSLTQWEAAEGPRRCGVSAFGLSGTNCHIVLEQAAVTGEQKSAGEPEAPKVLALSAHSPEALIRLADSYIHFVAAYEQVNLDDLCYTANTGRCHYSQRLIILFSNRAELEYLLYRIVENGLSAAVPPSLYYGACSSDEDALTLQAGQLVREMGAVPEIASRTILEQLCKLYAGGAEILWEQLYKNKQSHKISLPTYPFERSRCWLDTIRGDEAEHLRETENSFYQLAWKLSTGSRVKKELGSSRKEVLVFRPHSERGRQLAQAIKAQNNEVVDVVPGEHFALLEGSKYQVDRYMGECQDLLEALKSRKFSQVVYAFSMEDGSEPFAPGDVEVNESDAIGLLRLIKAILAVFPDQSAELVLITRQGERVTGEETLMTPKHGLLFGLGKVIRWENPLVKCRCIDTDDATTMDEIAAELEGRQSAYKIAYRANSRYTEYLEETENSTQQPALPALRNDGVYVITGGTGRIGLAIAQSLAVMGPVHIALLGRTPLPPREQWDSIAKDEESNNRRMGYIVKKIMEMETRGAKVSYHRVDVACEDELSGVLGQIRIGQGRINGVIHGAGVGVGMKGSLIGEQDEEEFKQVLSAKVQGTWLIDSLTRNDRLDFFVLFSSVTTLVGGIGGGAYIAANAYLDTFAAWRTLRGDKTLTINWPIWEDDVHAPGVIHHHAEEKQLFKVISGDHGVTAFHKAVRMKKEKLITGELNYASELLKLGDALPFNMSDKLWDKVSRKDGKKQSLQGRKQGLVTGITLTGKPQGTVYTETEQMVAGIWQEVLGYKELNIHDNFFEIGGDSIRIIKMQVLFEERLSGEISVSDLFAYPTIYKLAAYLNDSTGQDRAGVEPDLNAEELQQGLRELVRKLTLGAVTVEEAVKLYGDLGEKS